MSGTPFSIVVACYNGEKFIGDCMDSLVTQDYEPSLFQIVCVDDGSTDASPEILRGFARRHANVLVTRMENSGLEAASNRGLRTAAHERVVRADADDLLPPDFLKKMDAAIKKNPNFDFYYPKKYVELHDGGRKVLRELPDFDAEEIFARGDFFATGTVYKKRDLAEVGLYPEKIKNCGLENYSVVLDLLSRGKTGYAVPDASFFYRRHDANMSTVKRQAIVQFGYELLARHGRKFRANANHPYGLVLPS